ncbi:PAX3- and PAX7-binding protein 1-like [Apostichopus japonicus]|uniref:PAX3- and PAX7-binding protein 1-like n=1 Tax=Stichopus japonicus TaxID=307972 RepID=UPI003AB1684B
MMKKKQRNIRKRIGDSDEEELQPDVIPFLEEDYHAQVKKVVEERASKKKGKEKKSEKKSEKKLKDPKGKSSLLSFGAEEEDEDGAEVFQVKKSSMSRRLAKANAKMKKRKVLVKDEPQPGVDNSNSEESLSKPRFEETIKETFNIEDNIVLNGMDAEAAVIAEEDQQELNDGFRRLASGLIPDASMIHAIRKKRQMARELGTNYISLDDTQRFAGEKSRLVRDDDNDRSGSESDEGRMSFTVKQSTKRERLQEAMKPVVHHDSGSDQDEELERWEQEQIKKGISVPQTQTAEDSPYQQYNYPQPELAEVPYGVSAEQAWYGTNYNSETAESRPNIPPDASNLPTTFPSVSLQDLRKKISDRLEPLQEVHRAHEREYENMTERMKSSALSSVELKDSTGGVSGQYDFYQEMRSYVRDLVECLNEKVPSINNLETALLNLYKNRASFFIDRRQADIRDQSFEFMSQKAAAGANLAMKNSKAEREEKQRNRRAAEREARRARRRRMREGGQKASGHYEGMSSDDEQIDSQQAQMKADKERIQEEAKAIFQDVVDDFHSLPIIQSKFERWKLDHSDSYEEAYIGLCLCKLYNPFVRLQLLDWNPLESDCPSIESMDWFNTLLFYGYEESKELNEDDSDNKLLPNVVDKIVLPKLIALVENVWDPMSSSQTHRLVDTIQRLAEDYPTVSSFNKNTQALLQAIVTRLRKTLDDDVYVPLFPKSTLEQKGALAFAQRQFWSCVKLLGNVLSWHGLVDQQVLIEIALDGLLNRYILLSLQNSDVNEESLAKCQRIVSALPKQWFQDLQGDCTLKQLESFCKYQLNCVDTLHTSFYGGSETQKKSARTQIKAVTKLLVSIHAMDHALSVTSDYSLKDLKKMLD